MAGMDRKTSKELAGFKRFLHRRGLARATIAKYLRVVLGTLDKDDPTEIVRRPRTFSGWGVARSALSYWAGYRKDDELLEAVQAVPPPDRSEAPEPKLHLDRPGRDRIVEIVSEFDPPLREVMLGLIWSGIRPGAYFEIDHEALATAAKQTDPIARPCLSAILRIPGWERIGDLVTTNDSGAYFVCRRILHRICQRERIPPFPLEDFRRLLKETTVA